MRRNMRLENLWRSVRERFDKLLEYDPSPPAVTEKDSIRIIVHDGLPPEANAMAMAMYSRDPRSFLVHLKVVIQKGWKKFMSQYYVGYGHKSIGDCGTTNICAENVSMLDAKSIQANELYNGQEASTRYLDMSGQRIMNPLGTETGKAIQDRWMSFYALALEGLIPYLKNLYPRHEEEDKTTYEKAIKARAFDIARAFLPAGCTTYVGWHSTLRQAWDHIMEMRYHPLAEMRRTAALMLDALKAKYPSSFRFDLSPEQLQYLRTMGSYSYAEFKNHPEFGYRSQMDIEEMMKHPGAMCLIMKRPKKAELPDWFKSFGLIVFDFLLDFGSFRDMQRQRSATQFMPLLTLDYGMHQWYLANLPPELLHEARALLIIQESEIRKIENPLIRQYYIAMGYRVACRMAAGLPSAVYIAELRSMQTVHPTLRPVAQQMGAVLTKLVPCIKLYCDMEPDRWSIKRGSQDIVRKV